jgi:ankyrin repeat protein
MVDHSADYLWAIDWVAKNADKIDVIPDLEATYRTSNVLDFTPLEMAVIARRPELVEKLIVRGARTDNLDYMLGRFWKPEDVLKFCERISRTFSGIEMFARIIEQNDANTLNTFLDHGSKPNLSGVYGKTKVSLLDIALACGSFDCAELLIQRGAIVTTELMGQIICSYDTKTLRRLFLDAGALLNVNARAEGGETLLWMACSGVHRGDERVRVSMVSLLIKHGAEVNVATIENRTTPLMFSAARGDIAVISLLLAAGADTQARDREGRTALDFARMRNQTKAIELLQ